MKQFLKPTILKIILTLCFGGWAFLYGFGHLYQKDVGAFFELLRGGFGMFGWDGYILMRLSYLLIWIIVSVLIFVMIVFLEQFFVFMHNVSIKRNYIKAGRTDYMDFFKVAEISFHRERHVFFWLITLFLIFFSLFYLPGLFKIIEGTAQQVIETEYYKANPDFFYELNDSEKIFNQIRMAAFFVVAPLWYLVSSLIVFSINVGVKTKEEDEIEAEHNCIENAF
jgi:hypothetical protein